MGRLSAIFTLLGLLASDTTFHPSTVVVVSAFLPSRQPFLATKSLPPRVRQTPAFVVTASTAVLKIHAFRIQPQYLTASAAAEGANDDDGFVEAQDLEALQALFSKYCDKEGLMTKDAVQQTPLIAELLVSERNEIILLHYYLAKEDYTCSRITPRMQCRKQHIQNPRPSFRA